MKSLSIKKSAEIEVIIFDCMETLIEVKDKPDLKLYSSWAYHGSGVEGYWERFEDFYAGYGQAKEELGREWGKNREYSLYKRFEYLIERDFNGFSPELREMINKKLAENFWRNYRENCFVDEMVKETLAELEQEYRLGVVSNFMIDGGIEELLEVHGIHQHFEFIITSIREGWRKPAARIFQAALARAGVGAEKVLFVGDDYVCDYQGPGSLGIKAVLLDRKGNYPDVSERVGRLNQLRELLL